METRQKMEARQRLKAYSKKKIRYVQKTGIPTFQWPAHSPDLNPIENLWSILESKLKDRKPCNKDELFLTLLNGWNSLEVTLLTKLVESMPHRCQAVIDAKGYATKY